MNQLFMPGILNPSEAPDGFYAVSKSSVATPELGNICRACDWRPTCRKPDTDFTISRHRCMSYTVISARDGRELKRDDECSVVFKKLPVKESLTPRQTIGEEE